MRETAWAVLVGVALAILPVPASSTPPPIDPHGFGDRRVPVDPNQAPWNAIAKVQTNIGTRCTGVLVAPDTVLTAAHCLFNLRTQTFLQAQSVHVLFGFAREQYRWHRLVASVTLGPRITTPLSPPITAMPWPGVTELRWPRADDWARLHLSEPVPLTPLPLTASIAEGMPVMLAGYNQDRDELLMADLDCHVVNVTSAPAGAMLVTHDCSGTRGTSGGPLLTRRGDGWELVGINVAAGLRNNVALLPSSQPR